MRQIDLILPKIDLTHLGYELTLSIHSWLMSIIKNDYDPKLQSENELRPFSMFSRLQKHNIILRFSLLFDSAAPLYEIFCTAKYINVLGLKEKLSIINKIEKPQIKVDSLCKPAPNEFKLIIASPATYRHNGRESNMYSLPLLLNTVSEKLHTFENITISNKEIIEACEQVIYTEYNLHSVNYAIKPNVYRPGFEGELNIRPRGTNIQRDNLALLLRYAAYTGVGAKTALGMGGIFVFE